MSKGRIKKERLFDLFKSNFEFVKLHPQIEITHDEPGKYICPLCFEGFSKSDINPNSSNPLTMEDVPPKSLGGKPVILTCKSCNSTAGHKLDVHLLNILEREAFKGYSPNSKATVAYEKDGRKMNGKVEIDKNGRWHMHMEPKQSNPSHSKYILNEFQTKYPKVIDFEYLNNFKPKTVNFNLKIKEKGKLRNAEVNMLRIAYLLAFEKFGYGFLINDNLTKIREQIKSPEKDILNYTFGLRYDFPDNHIGIHVIKEPKELNAFIVIFKLKTRSFNRNFGIILPGPTAPGLKVYDYINDVICVGDGTKVSNIELQPFSHSNFVTNNNFANAFASHKLWQDIVRKENAD